jgi:cytoplasmic iron level regulating protein YaaA (DUF328/UPF0246 family)
MPEFAILLPPAEGKKAGGNPLAPNVFDYRASNTFNYFSELNPERRRLIDALQQAIEEGCDLEKLFGLKGPLLDEAVRLTRELYKAPLMAALDRYSPGVLYQALDFAGLPTGAQRRFLENTIIFSGLFGLLRPDDLIPNYRLRMEAVVPGIGKVSRYWRPYISPLLNELLKDRVVWNLLPAVHQEAWEDGHTYQQMIEVRFFREQKGGGRPVTHGVKLLRGRLVNFIVREGLSDPEGLRAWHDPEGYRLDVASSRFEATTRKAVLVMVKRG